jgi:pimeloyl-ACP methyl ester carboxylesterase
MIETSLPGPVAAALASPAGGDRLTIETAGIPFSALVWGEPSARPLLLIHGVTSSAANWWRVGPALAASGRRVVAVDLPGHGRTGHWQGHFRFRDNASDVEAFVREAGIARDELQVIGHSWGAMTAAALPAVGLRPSTLVLLEPPTVPFEVISREVDDRNQRRFTDIAEASVALRAANPAWADGDVRAKAEALTELDETAARSVLLDNGDWDGGLGDLADPAAAGIPVWVIRGDPAFGGYLPDEAVAALSARVGADHLISIVGAPHSPQRTHPVETTAALLRALGG